MLIHKHTVSRTEVTPTLVVVAGIQALLVATARIYTAVRTIIAAARRTVENL